MEKVIYISEDMKKNLENSFSNSGKIPFKEKLETGFSYQVTLGNDTLELGEKYVLQEGFYHSDRDQDIESTVESIIKVKTERLKEIQKPKVKTEKNKKTLVNKLNVEDFLNPLFDKQKPVTRKIPARPEIYDLIEDDSNYLDRIEEDFMMNPGSDSAREKYFFGNEGQIKEEPVIEGLTITDNFNRIGFTYCKLDGMLFLNYFDEKNKENVRLYEEVINSPEEFEKLLKKADLKIKKIVHS